MHDSHKAKDMVDFAAAKAKELGKNKVTKIYITVGDSSGYSAESILLYFKDLSEKTVCEDAEVVITTVKASLKCPQCGEVFPRKLMAYACPVCGTEGMPGKIGTEITIDGIEAE